MKYRSSREKLIVTLNHFFPHKNTLTELNVSKLLEGVRQYHMLLLSQIGLISVTKKCFKTFRCTAMSYVTSVTNWTYSVVSLPDYATSNMRVTISLEHIVPMYLYCTYFQSVSSLISCS